MPRLTRRRRPKHPASRANAQSKRVGIVTGVRSRALWGALDGRFAFTKAVNAYRDEYRTHVGDAITRPLADICESAARYRALANLAFADLMQRGVFDAGGNTRSAFAAFRQADADLRACLQALGLERREKPVPDLHDYLARRAA